MKVFIATTNSNNNFGVTELENLYIAYLRRLCPDWSEERIQIEVKNVFEAYNLYESEQRRQEFKVKLLQRFEQMSSQSF